MTDPDISELMTSADSPMVIVTTSAEGERAGCLVGFHSQSSLSPAQYCFCLSKANHTYRVSLRSTRFAIHFLTSDDFALACHFGTRSGEECDKFAGIELESDASGVPLLTALPNRMVVERIAMLDDGGDHVATTARVLSVENVGPFTPLRASAVADIRAGHASEERVIRPD